MTMITCEIQITKNGQTIETRKSTSKTLAKTYGSRKAKEVGGEYKVVEVTPYEFKAE